MMGRGRPLFERLKGRKPLSYGFLPFVTFAYTHFKMVEARGIEPLSERLFMQLSTSIVYLLRFPVRAAGRRAGRSGSPNTFERYGHTAGTFTTKSMPCDGRGTPAEDSS